MLHAILNGLLVFSSFATLLALLGPAIPAAVEWLNLLALADLLFVGWLLRSGRAAAAGIWLICSGLLVLAALTYSLGTVRSPAAASFVIILIVAGILFGLRGIILTSLASSLIIAGLAVAESAGQLPPADFSVSFTQVFTYIIVIATAGGLTYYALRLANQALAQARQENRQRQRLEQELRASEMRYRLISENVADVIWVLNLATQKITYISAQVKKMRGYSADEVLEQSMEEILSPASLQYVNALLPDRVADFIRDPSQKSTYTDELEQFHKDGSLVETEVKSTFVFNQAGEVEVFGVSRDITERKRMQAALRQSEAKYRIIADKAYDWEFWQAPSGEYIYISPACQGICGYSAEELIADPGLTRQLIHPEDLGMVDRHNALVKNQVQDEMVFRLYDKHGGLHWIEHSCAPIITEDGAYLGVRGSNHDITRRRQAEEALLASNEQLSQRVREVERLQQELREQTLHDPLTGLKNRRYLQDTLERVLRRAEHENQPLSILISDIDHFKQINDTYGHQVGDRFLVAVSQVIQQYTRGIDIVCRYGGEEFLVAIMGLSLDAAYQRADDIRQACAALTLEHDGAEIRTTISFGVATSPNHGSDPEQLIIKADKALYEAKKKGRNRVVAWLERYSADS